MSDSSSLPPVPCIFAVTLTLTEREMDALRLWREAPYKTAGEDIGLIHRVLARIVEGAYPVNPEQSV